jgi:hypothetical protein
MDELLAQTLADLEISAPSPTAYCTSSRYGEALVRSRISPYWTILKEGAKVVTGSGARFVDRCG